MRVHVVHGILTPVGASGLLQVVPQLRQAGFDVRVPDYGLITAAETRIVNPLIGRTLIPYVEPGDLYVGHSNGCAIGYNLMTSGSRLAGAVFINAALKRDIAPPAPTWVDVYYNEGDDATVAAVAAARVGLSDPVWGDLGHAGYLGDNPAVTNIDCGKTSSVESIKAGVDDFPAVSGHSDIFTPEKFKYWGPYIVQRIKAHLLASAR
jgi:hypothetical protein